MKAVRAGAVFLALLAGSPAGATTIFSDTFDTEPGSGAGASGQSQSAYAGFAQWTVSDGTVDLIAHGDFGIDCFGGAGKCVDLDGATNNAGVLTSVALNLAPGVYELSFVLAGTDSGFTQPGARNPNIVDVSVGALFATQVTKLRGEPFTTHGGTFSVAAPTTVSIVIANQGGDQFGAVLDSVSLTLVPEPGTAALLALGMSGLAAIGRRRA